MQAAFFARKKSRGMSGAKMGEGLISTHLINIICICALAHI